VVRICIKLNLPWIPTDFPTFKTGRRPVNITAQDLYTDAAKTHVANICALELDLFNYDFPV
jgi:hypothetical protein